MTTATDTELAVHHRRTKIVDARGSACPGPLLEAKKGIGGVSVGQVLEIWSSDPVTKTRHRRLVGQGRPRRSWASSPADGYDRVFVRRQK